MDKKIMIWDLLAHKAQHTIHTKKYAEMNHISLSENVNHCKLAKMLKSSKKSIKRFVI
jgi:hypothetical protein